MTEPGMDFEEQNLGAQAYTKIMECVVSRRIRPGRLMSQRELSELTMCSIPSVREALKALKAEGFAILLAKRGVLIREVSDREIRDIYNFRLMVELPAVKAFAATCDLDEVARMEAQFKDVIEQRPTTEKQANDLFVERTALDDAFHRQIIASLDNAFLLEIYQKMEVTLLLSRLSLPVRYVRQGPAFFEHLQILDALAKRDADGAQEALKTHLESARSRALGYFDFALEEDERLERV